MEAGGPPIGAHWSEREHVWADIAPKLYAAAAAAQWDPATAVDWTAPIDAVPPEIERAVVQVMTYLVENEQAALIIPARLLSQLHPHYREVMQLLATQAADEARHVEVFTRRGLLSGGPLGTSSAGGRASLATLLNEPDFTTASFLLSVLGEGTFVDLLRFLHAHAPDPVTADVTRLALRDEARHVAFGVAHTAHLAAVRPAYLGTLRQSVERRHAALQDTAGLNAEVFDSLVLLAAARGSPPRSAAAGSPSATSRPGWTRAAAGGWPPSASPTTRPRNSPPCTPATSCNPRGRGGRWRRRNPRHFLLLSGGKTLTQEDLLEEKQPLCACKSSTKKKLSKIFYQQLLREALQVTAEAIPRLGGDRGRALSGRVWTGTSLDNRWATVCRVVRVGA